MYVKLHAIKDAASFKSLSPILSEPVAFVRSNFEIFLNFFTGYFWYCKNVSVGFFFVTELSQFI